jgi:hypothetical protein
MTTLVDDLLDLLDAALDDNERWQRIHPELFRDPNGHGAVPGRSAWHTTPRRPRP